MKKLFFLLLVTASLIACSDRRPRHIGDLPIIDIIGNMGNFQRVYMSNLFSSIELIPLETNEDCLLNFGLNPLVNDSIIIMRGGNFRRLFAFDRTTGKFLNEIGRHGQGPGEFILPNPFFNIDQPTVFVFSVGERRILEYDFEGRYIRSFTSPEIDGRSLSGFAHIGDSLFFGSMPYTGDNEYQHFVFDHNTDIIQRFPNHIFFYKQGSGVSSFTMPMTPERVDNRLYIKDRLNDTIYVFENATLLPAYVFDFDQSIPIAFLETPITRSNLGTIHSPNFHIERVFVATPKFFFYEITVPYGRTGQRVRPVWNPFLGEYRTPPRMPFYGIYDRVQNKSILLDTDQHLRQGIVNDINGGLSFIPQFYAGNGEIVGFWNPEDMLEILTEEYFATKTIKDPEAHQRLRAVLRNLQFDDNPVIVIARLKE